MQTITSTRSLLLALALLGTQVTHLSQATSPVSLAENGSEHQQLHPRQPAVKVAENGSERTHSSPNPRAQSRKVDQTA